MELEDEGEEELSNPNSDPEQEPTDTELAHILVHALAGIANFQTMRVRGHCGKRTIQLLLNSGSTHNFIDSSLARRLGCKVSEVPPMIVRVADGGQLGCGRMVNGFTWKMQGKEFVTDVLLLPLGGCDLVLGVQWLSSLGPILWNFKELTMQFQYLGEKVMLRGSQDKQLRHVNASRMGKILKQGGELSSIQLLLAAYTRPQLLPSTSTTKETVPQDLATLISHFPAVISEPTCLPPLRTDFDHRMPLNEGTNPINMRPYKYPLVQKDIIENLTQELLDHGVIRNSTSPCGVSEEKRWGMEDVY